MNFLLSAVSLIIIYLASGFYAYITGISPFESFVTIALGYIILRDTQNDLKNNK